METWVCVGCLFEMKTAKRCCFHMLLNSQCSKLVSVHFENTWITSDLSQ